MIDVRGLLDRRAVASLSDVEVLRLQALSRPEDSLLSALAFLYAMPEDVLVLHSSRDALRMRQSFVLAHRSFAPVSPEAVPVQLMRAASLEDWLDWVGAELPAPPILTHLRNISQAGRAPQPPVDAVPDSVPRVLSPWPVLAPLPPSGPPAGGHGAAPNVTHSRTGVVDVAHAQTCARVERVTFEGGIACCESAEQAEAYLNERRAARLSAQAHALARRVRELYRVARLNAPKRRTDAEVAERTRERERRVLARRALSAQASPVPSPVPSPAQAAPTAPRRAPRPATFGPSGTVHALPWTAQAPAQAPKRPTKPDTAGPAPTPTGALSTRPARHETPPTQKHSQKAQAQAKAPRHTTRTPTPTPKAVTTRPTPGECKPAPPQPRPPERESHFRKFTLDGSAQTPLRQPLPPQDMTDAHAAHALITYLISHQAWTIDRAVRLHVPISDEQLTRVRQGPCAHLLSTQTVAGQAQYRLTATDAARDAQILAYLTRFKTATLPVVIAEQLHLPLADILPSLRRLTARGDLRTVTGQQGGYRVPDGHPVPDLAAQLLTQEAPCR